MKRTLSLLLFVVLSAAAICQSAVNYVKVNGNSFEIAGKPYYYIGTNFWYGGIIASTGIGGNRARLIKELDFLKQNGINNLRILVGAEGPNNEPFRVTPALQLAPGIYNDTLLDGLDYLLAEMGKRKQYAILYLQNSWDWSGGYAQYLNWNGYGPIPYPMVKPNTWPEFINYAKKFHNCRKCKEQFGAFVKYIVTRTNRYTKVPYTNDAAIMTWEIGNEPRAFGNENIPNFEQWLSETASLIKSLDKNHLVTTGTEGQYGCEQSITLFERIHANPNIDYLTMHIWPKNWGWIKGDDIAGCIDTAIVKTNDYMDQHFVVARKLQKPIVLEEFGLPRDKHGYTSSETTLFRDKYYRDAFNQVIKHAKKRDVLAGCNFWSYAGFGRPVSNQVYWKPGDEYLGDPPVEEQGLNSVFDTDSAINIVNQYNKALKNN